MVSTNGQQDAGEVDTIANLREAYAASARQSLEWDENAERAIDRVAAAGLVERFGIDLWRARYGLDSASFINAIKLLTRVYAERYPRDGELIAGKVADQVIAEYMASFCTSCLGSREMVSGDLKAPCSACSGTGLRNYSDEERSRLMCLSYAVVKASGHKLQWIHNYVATQDSLVNDAMVRELERLT